MAPSDPDLNNDTIRYASPQGDDTNDGKSWRTAMLTGYVAAVDLISTGSGTLYLADGTSWGGPVPGQGIWLRNDGVPADGFLAYGQSIRIIGCPRQGAEGFIRQAPANISMGGSKRVSDRRFPAVWICGTNQPVFLENIRPAIEQDCPYRIGVDYERNLDGSINELTVTNASRAGGETTFTVTLPTGLQIRTASRTGSEVALTVELPIQLRLPWKVGQLVRVTSSHSDFPSGDYVLTTSIAVATDVSTSTVTYKITYTQGSGSATGANIGTVQSHACQADEYLDLFFDEGHSSAEFPPSMYRVIRVPAADQIVVNDIYGYSPRSATASASNIGTLCHQDRSMRGTSGVTMQYCGGRVGNFASGVDNFLSGPFVDLGSNDANWLELDRCEIGGYFSDAAGINDPHYDPDRGAGVLMDGGAHVTGGAAIYAHDCSSSDGGIRLRSHGGTDYICVQGWLGDTSTFQAPPAVEVVSGSPFVTVLVERADVADNMPSIPNVKIAGCDPLRVVVRQCGFVSSGRVIGHGLIDSPPANAWVSDDPPPSPWAEDKVTTWADLRITGKHPAGVRTMGPVAARFANLALGPSSWQSPPNTTSSSAPAPDGSSTAVRLTTTVAGSTTVITQFPFRGKSWAVGGRIVFGVWVNAHDGFSDPFLAMPAFAGEVTFDVTGITSPYSGRGWQWVSNFITIVSLTTASPLVYGVVQCHLGVTDLWGMTILYVPPELDENDFREFVGTMKHQPIDLGPGQTGTMEGQAFIAHGGFGISPSIVAPVTTLGGSPVIIGYMPLYAPNGTFILGYTPIYGVIPTSGLALWLKADALTGTDGSSVATWPDASINGNDAVSLSGAAAPILRLGVFGGLNAVRFNGTSNGLGGAFAVSGATGMTVFYVARTGASINADQVIMSSGTGHPLSTAGIQWGFALCSDSASGQAGWVGPSQNIPLGNVAGLATSTAFFARYWNDKTQWRLDGLNSTNIADTSFPSGTAVNYQLGVQNNSVAASWFQGDLAELIVYTVPLSDSDMVTVKNYLKTKWGLP